jgi:hypothetical protein
MLLCRQRFNLVGRKEESVARLAEQSQISARVIVQHNREVDFTLIVLLDRLNYRSLSDKRQVKDVTTVPRPQTHPATFLEIEPRHLNMVQ